MPAFLSVNAQSIPNASQNLLKGIENILDFAVASLLVLLVTTVASAVVARYLFNTSLAGTKSCLSGCSRR